MKLHLNGNSVLDQQLNRSVKSFELVLNRIHISSCRNEAGAQRGNFLVDFAVREGPRKDYDEKVTQRPLRSGSEVTLPLHPVRSLLADMKIESIILKGSGNERLRENTNHQTLTKKIEFNCFLRKFPNPRFSTSVRHQSLLLQIIESCIVPLTTRLRIFSSYCSAPKQA